MICKDVLIGAFIFCSIIVALYLGLNTIDKQIKFLKKQEQAQRINQMVELESSTDNSVKLWVRCNLNVFNTIIPSDIKCEQYNTHIWILEGPPHKIAKLLKKVYGLEAEKPQ